VAVAGEIVAALGGHRHGRGWRARCPAHHDEHPSLDIEDRDGRVLFICRAGYAQAEVLQALGLWPDETPQSSSRAARRPTIRELVAASAYVPPPACCLNRESKCAHRLEFERQYLIAHLRGNLACAKREIIERFAAARQPLGVEQLFVELHAAVAFGAIAPPELPRAALTWTYGGGDERRHGFVAVYRVGYPAPTRDDITRLNVAYLPDQLSMQHLPKL
jgi:hypothetical protein